MQPHQEAKLDKLLEHVAAMAPQVADTKADVHGLREELTQVRIEVVQDRTNLQNLQVDFDGLGGKVRTHVADTKKHTPAPEARYSGYFKAATVRWKFIGAVSGSLLAAVTLIAALTSMVKG